MLFAFLFFAASRIPVMTEAEVIKEVKAMKKRSGYAALVLNKKYERDDWIQYCFKQMMRTSNALLYANERLCIIYDFRLRESVIRHYINGMDAPRIVRFNMVELLELWGGQNYGSEYIQSRINRINNRYLDVRKKINDLKLHNNTKDDNDKLKKAIAEKEKIIKITNEDLTFLFDTRQDQRQIVREYIDEYGNHLMKEKYKFIYEEKMR